MLVLECKFVTKIINLLRFEASQQTDIQMEYVIMHNVIDRCPSKLRWTEEVIWIKIL